VDVRDGLIEGRSTGRNRGYLFSFEENVHEQHIVLFILLPMESEGMFVAAQR
jgi:hypothetical protein